MTPFHIDCHACKHYRATMLFELCGHTASTYTIAGKSDQHTVGYMRDAHSACGPDGKLFEQRAP